MFLNLVNQSIMVDGSTTDYDDVFAYVVSVMELDNHVSVDCPHIVDVSQDGKPHLVISVRPAMC